MVDVVVVAVAVVVDVVKEVGTDAPKQLYREKGIKIKATEKVASCTRTLPQLRIASLVE